MATKFIGHYKLDSSENFDAFMEALGVNVALRQIGKLSKPQFTMEHIEGDRYKIKEWTAVKSHTWEFTVGEEFADKTVDGRSVLTTFSLEGENFILTEKAADGSGQIVTYIWELTADKDISAVLKVGDVVAKRLYKRLES